MAKITRIIHAVIWVLLGLYCVISPFLVRIERVSSIIVAFGFLSLLNAMAALFRWRIWKLTGPVVGFALASSAMFMSWAVPGEGVGAWVWILLVLALLALGFWSLSFPLTQSAAKKSD